MLAHTQQNAIERLVQGKPLVDGQNWLIETHIDETISNKGPAYGWKHQYEAPQAFVSTWGGTVDGVRGLLACGLSPADPLIQKSVEWMKRQQRDDGSFVTWGIKWSSVETTAWTLLALHEFDQKCKGVVGDDVIKQAVAFLVRCTRDGGLRTSDSVKDDVRIYPSAITLWALHGRSLQKEKEIAEFLKKSVHQEGGWGIEPDSSALPAMTAIVLYILLTTEHLETADAISQKAKSYLLSNMNPDGTWDTYTEKWGSTYQQQGESLNTCGYFTPAWGILALLKVGVDVLDESIMKALTWLIDDQEEPTENTSPKEGGGAWRFVSADTEFNTWCTSNALICLKEVHEELFKPRVVNGSKQPTYRAMFSSVPEISPSIAPKEVPDLSSGGQTSSAGTQEKSAPKAPAHANRQSTLRFHLTQGGINIFLIVLILFALFKDYILVPIISILKFVVPYLFEQRNNIISGLISNGIWLLLALGVGEIFRRLVKKVWK